MQPRRRSWRGGSLGSAMTDSSRSTQRPRCARVQSDSARWPGDDGNFPITFQNRPFNVAQIGDAGLVHRRKDVIRSDSLMIEELPVKLATSNQHGWLRLDHRPKAREPIAQRRRDEDQDEEGRRADQCIGHRVILTGDRLWADALEAIAHARRSYASTGSATIHDSLTTSWVLRVFTRTLRDTVTSPPL